MKTEISIYRGFKACGALSILVLLIGAAHAQDATPAPGSVASGLEVWLRAGSGVARSGNEVISWTDISGNGNDATHNYWNIYGELPPIYVDSNPAINGRPSIRFNNQHALEINLEWLAGSDYTVIVVNGRDRYGVANFYIAGSTALPNENLVLGYEQEGLLRQAHFSNDLDATVEPYQGQPLWKIDTFTFSQSEGRDIYQNGAHVATDDNIFPLTSNVGSTLGHFRAFGPFFWYQGDLAEVLVYDRVLSAEERLRVESELSGLYGTEIDPGDYVPCLADYNNNGDYVSSYAMVVNTIRKARQANGPVQARFPMTQVPTAARSGCGGSPN